MKYAAISDLRPRPVGSKGLAGADLLDGKRRRVRSALRPSGSAYTASMRLQTTRPPTTGANSASAAPHPLSKRPGLGSRRLLEVVLILQVGIGSSGQLSAQRNPIARPGSGRCPAFAAGRGRRRWPGTTTAATGSRWARDAPGTAIDVHRSSSLNWLHLRRGNPGRVKRDERRLDRLLQLRADHRSTCPHRCSACYRSNIVAQGDGR